VSRCRQAPGPPLRVSKGDPFASCLVGGNGSGLNYRSAEVEPWIADKPANTANLIGTWQQDRWSDGGAKGQVASWSFDAGRTWGQTPQPFIKCAQPFYGTPVLQYERTSDPWVSIGPDGTAYAVSLPFDGNFIRNGLGTAVSHDGGRSWVDQQDIDPLVARADTLDPSDDKESVTADPQRAGWAYAVWDQLQDIFPPCPTAQARAAVSRGREGQRRAQAAVAGPQPCPNLFTGPGFFSRTRDGGKSWEKPRPIVPTGPNEQTISNQIVVDRHTGVLYDFFDLIEASGVNNIELSFRATVAGPGVHTSRSSAWRRPRRRGLVPAGWGWSSSTWTRPAPATFVVGRDGGNFLRKRVGTDSTWSWSGNSTALPARHWTLCSGSSS
jgi:hypothetical protein